MPHWRPRPPGPFPDPRGISLLKEAGYNSVAHTAVPVNCKDLFSDYFGSFDLILEVRGFLELVLPHTD